jgi:predicted RNase H-like nuclease
MAFPPRCRQYMAAVGFQNRNQLRVLSGSFVRGCHDDGGAKLCSAQRGAVCNSRQPHVHVLRCRVVLYRSSYDSVRVWHIQRKHGAISVHHMYIGILHICHGRHECDCVHAVSGGHVLKWRQASVHLLCSRYLLVCTIEQRVHTMHIKYV